MSQARRRQSTRAESINSFQRSCLMISSSKVSSGRWLIKRILSANPIWAAVIFSTPKEFSKPRSCSLPLFPFTALIASWFIFFNAFKVSLSSAVKALSGTPSISICRSDTPKTELPQRIWWSRKERGLPAQ